MRLRGVIIAVGLLLVAAPCRGQHVDDVPAAREHYAKGKRLYDLGRFGDAAKEYEAAYQAKDDPALLFNLGQAHRLAHEYPQALLAYKAYLRNVPDAPNRAEVEQRIAELQAQIDAQERARRGPPPDLTPTPSARTPPSASALTASAPPPRTSIAKKPWFWVAVVGGAAVIATSVAVGVVYGRRDPMPTSGSVAGP
ncbi:MAG TPA: tetratricopeptide repeat protein [Polyangia bacterium]|nr:tetratricopeptide repeat protein [Polyangia bacterium]